MLDRLDALDGRARRVLSRAVERVHRRRRRWLLVVVVLVTTVWLHSPLMNLTGLQPGSGTWRAMSLVIIVTGIVGAFLSVFVLFAYVQIREPYGRDNGPASEA